MKVYLNSKEINSPKFNDSKTYEQLFDILLNSYIPENHGVTAIDIDGVSYDNSLVCSKDLIKENLNIIKIETRDNIAIAKNGIKNSLTLIEAIGKTSLEIAQHMRNDEIKKGSVKVIALMEAFKPLVEFLNSLSLSFKINFNEIEIDDGTISSKVDELVESMNEIVDAQCKKDYVELADYYEYQMPEDMELWREIVLVLEKEIKSMVSSN